MRMSRLLLRTLRDDPADADTAGHALLVRAGYVRRVASGIYTFLPLGTKVLHKASAIVREELDRAGMQELLMPALSPIELWEQSGRAKKFGSDALPAMVLDVRGGRFVLGLTHEEVVTSTVSAEVDSYRQLPLTVYQIQTKFRDEARPRFGLLRGREFLMCDAYSFDVDKAAMVVSYDVAKAAYLRIFERLELPVTPVEALSGAIGGDVNHEFMVASPIGEDHFVRCEKCGYAANVEAAAVGPPHGDGPGADERPARRRVATPDAPTIEAVVALLSDPEIDASRTLKAIAAFDEGGEPVVVLVPGDREAKLPRGWRLFEDEDFAAHPELVRGYLGPVDLGVRVVADASVVAADHAWVVGANEPGAHLKDVVLARDFDVHDVGDYVVARAGDRCTRCGGDLELVRAVEAAHIFQLGLTYTAAPGAFVMEGATFTAEDGTEQPFWMGCYGFGLSRLLAVLAEAFHDDHGLCWPPSSAPYDVHICAPGSGRTPAVRDVADALYAELTARGVDVLYDDRDVSAGVSFADADLVGVPLRVTVGARGLERGIVEVRDRTTGEVDELAVDAAATALHARRDSPAR
ncbi:MAG TPA: proline--tRNA ligase [Acidimicrobiales bacterium]|nr:proline--tRNA ligase [Acidimicrobiales bacterium]